MLTTVNKLPYEDEVIRSIMDSAMAREIERACRIEAERIANDFFEKNR